jgi:hypothetical protein
MKRLRKTYLVTLLIAISIVVPKSGYADNVEVQLPSSDGTDAFQVKDSLSSVLMHMMSNGRLGIGTTSPGARLEIQGDSFGDAIRVTSSAGGGDAAVRATATVFGTYGVVGESDSYFGGSFRSSSGTALEATTSSGYAAIFSGGNVGIGTTSPGEKLDVNGNLFMSGGDIKTDRWVQSDTNTGIGVGVFGAGNLSHTSGLEGWGNTAIGHGALRYNTTGFYNTANGEIALYLNTTGAGNTANGNGALRSNISGAFNTAKGSAALFSNPTGIRNTANGNDALRSNTTGNGNTANGWGALQSNTEGINNIALGYLAGDGTRTGSNNIIIGHIVDVPSANGSNQMSIGNLIYATGVNGVNTTVSTGNVGIGTPSPADRLHVAGDIRVGTGTTGCVKDANGTVIAGVCSSDSRMKRDIEPFPKVLDKLVQIQPVNFLWKTDEFPEYGFGTSESFGLVAQQVEKIMPDLVTEDSSGYKAVRYNKLPLLMLQAMKEQQEKIEELTLHTLAQQNEIEATIKEIRELRLGVAASSIRFKENVQDIGASSGALMKLRPVSFNYREEWVGGENVQQFGLIAEEVAEVAPGLVQLDDEGKPFSVRYQFLAPMLLNEVQQQERTIEQQKAQIETLGARLAALESRLGTKALGSDR